MRTAHRAVMAAAICAISGAASGQTVVTVVSGQTLTEADLLAGSFNGTPFTLGPDTILRVLFGGTIGPISVHPAPPPPAVSFQGTRVQLAGGNFVTTPSETGAEASRFSDVTLQMSSGALGNFVQASRSSLSVQGSGASVGRSVTFFQGSTVNISRGLIDRDFLLTDNGSMVVSGSANVGTNLELRNGSSLIVSGGTIGPSLGVFNGGTLTVTGGSIGSNAAVGSNSTAAFTGGTFQGIDFSGGSTVDISGSTNIVRDLQLFSGSVANISGGNIGSNFDIWDNSIANVRGGIIGPSMRLLQTSTLNLFVTQATIDGVPLQLTPFQTFEITTRAGLLEVLLEDGSFFDLRLSGGTDFVSATGTLTVTLVVPAPGAAALLALSGALAARRRR